MNGTLSVLAGRPAVAALDALGIDAEPALRAARLSREGLASIENRLPYDSIRSLWDAAAAASGDRAFGAHVAEKLPKGGYDVIDYLMSSAATVRECLTRVTQYARIIYDHSNLRLAVEPGHARMLRRVAVPAPQYEEFTLTLLLVRSRQATGLEWTPDRMSFQHEGSDDAGELSRVFGCPIAFGSSQLEMRFAPSILELPHTRSDSKLLDLLVRYADSLLTSLPSLGDLVASVSSSIARQIAHQAPSLSLTAAAVHLPERTLQRRLAERGVSHSGLVDEVRRGLALKYLGDAGLSVGEIGYILHFADTTAFHRAFKRWTGETPLRYRNRHLGLGRRD